MDWEVLLPAIMFIIAGAVGLVISFAGIAETFLQGLQMISLYILFVGIILLPGGLLKGGLPTLKGPGGAFAALGIVMLISIGIVTLILFL